MGLVILPQLRPLLSDKLAAKGEEDSLSPVLPSYVPSFYLSGQPPPPWFGVQTWESELTWNLIPILQGSRLRGQLCVSGGRHLSYNGRCLKNEMTNNCEKQASARWRVPTQVSAPLALRGERLSLHVADAISKMQ